MQDLRALVVDDSKVGRLTMMKKLEAMGLKVELAESGQQALYYLSQHRPDMIFMDHMMPEMDGFEVTRRIKASPATRDIPVIIISGNDDAEFLQEARAAGAIDAIAKPPAAGVLEALLASLPKPPVEAAVAAPIPQPAAEPAPTLDMTAVHALLERLVGTAVTPLHDDLMAEVGQRLAAESGNQRKTLAEWGERLDQQAADLAELRRGMADADSLGNRLQALEQRLLPLESEAGRPQADFEALQASMDQRGEARLIQLRAEVQTELQAELQARVDDHAAAMEQTAAGWGSRLDAFAETLDQIAQDLQSMRSSQAESIQSLEERIARMRDAASVDRREAAAPVAVVADGESEAMRAFQAELGELREGLSEDRLRQLVAETVASQQPPAEAERVVAESEAPPVAIPNQSAELAQLAQLQGKVKMLSVITAVGGALLLAVIGMLVFGG